ncbi:hypothetical protein L1765_02305 [Microaerobacter geothermalis]|nr:hypothetical protein [Microaerobacter geothermalis]
MLYLEPQFHHHQGEILNIVNQEGNAVGYLCLLYREKDEAYVIGQLDDAGEKQNFLDIVSHYSNGIKQATGGKEEPYLYIHVGGERLSLEPDDESTKPPALQGAH